MGMTIDTVNQWLKIQRQNLKDFPEIASDKKIESLDTAISYLEDYQQLMRKYQQLQADYENRLKADMVAMLTDIQLDIEGQKFDTHIDKDVWNDAIRVCSGLIQQRINELKEDV